MAVYQMVADTRTSAQKKKDEAYNKKLKQESYKKMMASSEKAKQNYVPLEKQAGAGTAKSITYHYAPTSSGTSNTDNKTNNTSAQDAYNAYLNSLGAGGSGGGGAITPQIVDLTDILASYEQGAAAQRQTITDSRESQRQSLLSSLKRFQEETAEARSQQRRSYNASRADLEEQAFMANRQAAQNAAARGLGGSGLQQLAQLQNLVNQSAAADKLAQSNTDVLKALATAAQNKEEDTNTAIQNLETEAANKIAQIDANNAQAKANLQYQEAVRYEEARQAAQALAAQLAASNSSAANSYKLAALENAANQEALNNTALTSLDNITKAGLDALQSVYDTTQKNKNRKTTDATKQALAAEKNIYLENLLNSANKGNVDYSTYSQQLNSLYNTLVNKNKNNLF